MARRLLLRRPRQQSAILFARKIRVEYDAGGKRAPAPLKWLDSFSMRNFTNDQIFDDTLPVSDGLLEAGAGRLA